MVQNARAGDAMGSYRHAWLLFIHHPKHQPADRAFRVADRIPGGRAVAGNDHPLMHAGAVGIDGDLRHPLRFTRAVDWLADNKPPPLEAWMLPGGDDVAFNAG